jgi:sigma-B regulation protein RsbU (phosphoserine phosphatase)
MLSHAEISIQSPASAPLRHRLSGDSISIGRASDCTIPIKDRYLSRKHAEIMGVRGEWVLRDCGSANGTYLNGVRLDNERTLRSGDLIRIGDTEIVFESTEHNTDRVLAIADTAARATIAVPLSDLAPESFATADPQKLQTLNQLAAELIEDRPLDELFGFIAERVLLHTKASRAAIGILGPDLKSFSNVEVRRQDKSDTSEVRISRTVLADVVQEKKALAFMDVGADEKLNRRASIMMQGIRSILCAPLLIADSVVGVVYVDYRVDHRPISEDDVRLVAQIGRFAAMKLETTRLREDAIQKRILDEELKTASMIQRRLLPPPPAGIAGFTFSSVNRPCRTVSGDYYDFVERPDGRIYFAIADVSGKGVTAGLMMAGLQASFRIFCKNDPSPAQLLVELNSALKENLPQSKFVTLFLGRLDTRTGTIEYANAGHTPPVVVRGTGVEELTETDLLLGVVRDVEYTNRVLHLAPGDALVLFTDGLSEAENLEGEDLVAAKFATRLASLHGSSADVVTKKIDEVVQQHVGDVPLTDDVTVVVVSRSLHAGVVATHEVEDRTYV